MLIQINPFPASPSGESGAIDPIGYKSTVHAGTGSTVAVSLTDLSGSISSPATDDVVLVMVGAEGNDTDYNLSVTGYTERCDLAALDARRSNLGIYTKRMGVSPDTSVTISATDTGVVTHVRILVLRGVNATTPMDVAVVTGTGIDTNGSIPAITPVTAGAMVVGAKFNVYGNSLNTIVMNNPISYSPYMASIDGAASSCLGCKEWPGSGAVGPVNNGGGTGNNVAWCAAALAFRPA